MGITLTHRESGTGSTAESALFRCFAGLQFRPDDPAERQHLYTWINAHEQRTLLLLDGVDDLPEPEIVRLGDVIDELTAHVRNVRILLTARRRLLPVGQFVPAIS